MTACASCGERCDICGERICSTYGPALATTCAAHRHCEDCDRDNPCRDCADERRRAADDRLRLSPGAMTW